MNLEEIRKNNCELGIEMTQFDGCFPRVSNKWLLTEINNKQVVSFCNSNWEIAYEFSNVPDNKEAIDGKIKFKNISTKLYQANMSIFIKIENWSRQNYVLMPAAVYNGNRFEVSKQPYPPILSKENKIGIDIPITITDVPRLDKYNGVSNIQLRAGDMSTPAVGFYNPHNKRGFFLITTQNTPIGENGIGIKESGSSNDAIISLSAPAVRHNNKYGMCTTNEQSDDKGYNFNENEEFTLKFRLYFFECSNVISLFNYFFNIRKDLSEKVKLYHEIPFSKAWEIQEKKYNTYNWMKEQEFYKISTADSIFGEWQTGWVGGGMNSYPLLFAGNELSRERAHKTIDFLFKKTQSPSGFFYGIIYKGTAYGDNFKNMEDANFLLLRKNADVIYYIIKQFILLKELGIGEKIKNYWEKGLRKACDAFLRLWKKYRQFGQFVDIDKEEIIIGGTASSGIISASLALASDYYKHKEYLSVAKESAIYYYDNFVRKGITNGAPGEILQCPDSESAFALLDSYMVLYEITSEKRWLEMAEDTACQCATWVMSYDFDFPKSSAFEKRGIHSAGTVFANVQNKHSAPGICTSSGVSLFKLYRATGNELYIQLIQEIAHNLPQFLSREDNPLTILWNFDDNEYNGDLETNELVPPGWMNERVNTSDWEGKENIGGVPGGSCWCEVSNMLTYIEIPGLYIQKDTGFVCAIDHVDAKVIEEDENKLVIKLENKTNFCAKVKVFVENSNERVKPMGQNSLLHCQEVIINKHSIERLLINR